eukprot:TRINITY_DN4938_c0_g1::TRINITY_DN4938_c0_g1_i1::g.16627::m.16627 TRINITY_DN4938_c0_g1::TRINITY_DN4938_c0_g1_i1::g.16627  ORF type:complete len:313 (+),score=63.29,Polysacc_deac_1/PF01522.16/7.1e-10,Polysacc_deac_1/PF01522.16/1.5e+03,Cu-binding_MopE/PF11617.3/0.0051 TRINITY_DN4938_c0_g1_i1:113-940(+)
MALHTVTHSTGRNTTYEQFWQEIAVEKNVLVKLGLIPDYSIVGFRAPYLEFSQELFQVLESLDFLYDSSIPEAPNGAIPMPERLRDRSWPYTFDLVRNSTSMSCYISDCPNASYPGMWEIPHEDPLSPEGERLKIMEVTDYDVLRANFDARYNGNRAPLGLFLHPTVLTRPGAVANLSRLLDDFEGLGDVWLVTPTQMLHWLNNPTDKFGALTFKPWQCERDIPTGPEVCDGVDNDGDGEVDENLTQLCCYEFGCFRTCRATCPAAYPDLNNPVT